MGEEPERLRARDKRTNEALISVVEHSASAGNRAFARRELLLRLAEVERLEREKASLCHLVDNYATTGAKLQGEVERLVRERDVARAGWEKQRKWTRETKAERDTADSLAQQIRNRAERAEAEVERLAGERAQEVIDRDRILDVLRKEEAWRIELQAECERLTGERDAEKKYAEEGWSWLEDALRALGAKDVFEIKAKGAECERLAGRVAALERKHEVTWERLRECSDARVRLAKKVVALADVGGSE